MRTFTAVDIEPHIRERIDSLVAEVKEGNEPIKWVETQNMHITLYFFGEVEPTSLALLEQIIEESVNGIRNFHVTISGISAFPSVERPRVIWVGVENPGNELVKIYRGIHNGVFRSKDIKDRGDKKEYTPHITVGRAKGRCSKRFVGRLHECQSIDFGGFEVGSMVLYHSRLTPKGPIYEKLRTFSF